MTGELDRAEAEGLLGEDRSELSLEMEGAWFVVTEQSVHLFDLNDGISIRLPGKDAPATLNDTPRRIREIEVCRVGELGRWTMMPYAWQQDVEFTWHISTPIVRIVEFLYRAEPLANGEAYSPGKVSS